MLGLKLFNVSKRGLRAKWSHFGISSQQLLAVCLPQATCSTRYHGNLTLDIHDVKSVENNWQECMLCCRLSVSSDCDFSWIRRTRSSNPAFETPGLRRQSRWSTGRYRNEKVSFLYLCTEYCQIQQKVNEEVYLFHWFLPLRGSHKAVLCNSFICVTR